MQAWQPGAAPSKLEERCSEIREQIFKIEAMTRSRECQSQECSEFWKKRLKKLTDELSSLAPLGE